jgi:hypothetical protein
MLANTDHSDTKTVRIFLPLKQFKILNKFKSCALVAEIAASS